MQKLNQTIAKQKGAVLILLAFIIGLGVLAYLLHAFDPARLKLEQDKKTMQTLNEAKQALIAWSVSHPLHPGQMPFPDRGSGGGYDGRSDCNPPNNNPLNYNFLIGQLPIYGQTAPCVNPRTGIGGDFKDAQGNRLWYAVSRNLTHKYETDPFNTNPIEPVINPNIVNNPVYAWLKVLDRNGALVSDRVVAVIIAPNNPLNGQNRSAVAPPSEFLDTFIKTAKNYNNADYTRPDEEFVIGEDSRNVSTSDATFVRPYNFNDKLIYITIDELMNALNNRAAVEASNLLKSYKAKTGQFPYAANLGASLNNNISSPPNQQGSLPIDVTDNCSCTITSPSPNCSCSFKAITSVTFTKNSGTWSSITGACVIAGNACTCNGAGDCKRSGINFTCTATGNCSTNQTGVNLFTYSLPSYADTIPDNSGCFFSGSNPACNNDGVFGIGLKEAAWFKDNLWQDFFYYTWSSPASLQVGGKTGIDALLVAANATLNATEAQPLIMQSRPSNIITNYLDSAINTDNNFIFDDTNKPKANNYNDQTFIITP